MNGPSLIRDFDQISEEGGGRRSARLGTLVLVSLAGGCLAFALMAHSKRTAPSATQTNDPLGDLVAKGKASPAVGSTLAGAGVSFPSILSDAPQTTTALAVVRDQATPSAVTLAAATPLATPPAASDRLRVVPLPASDRALGPTVPTLAAKDVTPAATAAGRPRDALTAMAKESSAPSGPTSESGHAGGYQLQASSFPTEPEATAFATSLRQRGHRAYVESAQIPGRGQWYRVRIGPFATKHEAMQYRAEFERRERIAPYLVDPNQTATDSAHPRGAQALRDANGKESGESRAR